jgi:hypothetical protein
MVLRRKRRTASSMQLSARLPHRSTGDLIRRRQTSQILDSQIIDAKRAYPRAKNPD